MKWLVHAWNGNERDNAAFKIVKTREQVLAIALQVVGEFDITVDQDSNIEGKRRTGGEAWFSAVMVPRGWEGEYDGGWDLTSHDARYLFVFEREDSSAEHWEPQVHIVVPLEGKIDSHEFEAKIPMCKYRTPMEAICAGERAYKAVDSQIKAIGERVVTFIERELASVVDVAEIRRAGASEEKE